MREYVVRLSSLTVKKHKKCKKKELFLCLWQRKEN